MARQPVVLCLQDTTELDFNGQAAIGLGPLSYEAQRGMYLHLTYAVTLYAIFERAVVAVSGDDR